jgi:hypothetical protein
VSIDVRVDTSELNGLVKQLERLNARGISFATQRATNNVAFKVRDAWKTKAAQVFDRPTPFTRNSVLVQRAGTFRSPGRFAGTGTELARVFIRDEAAGITPQIYLQQQVLGGERRLKRSERALQSIGVLPSGFFVVPGQGAKLDNSGNVRAGQITRILSALRANNDPGQNQTERSAGRARRANAAVIFALPAPRGRLLPGVYERRGRAITPLLIFVRGARYRTRFDVFQYAREVVQREARPEMEKQVVSEIERALAKAARAAGNGPTA